MLRIRQIHDLRTTQNRWAAKQIKTILLDNFAWLSAKHADSWLERISKRSERGFLYSFLIATGRGERVRGVAIYSLEEQQRFGYLDFLAVDSRLTSGGLGGGLYLRARAELAAHQARGLFIEALSTNPQYSKHPRDHSKNMARIRFYERLGAVPVRSDALDSPRKNGDAYQLLFDGNDMAHHYSTTSLRRAVERILSAKDSFNCTRSFIDAAVRSIGTSQVQTVNAHLAPKQPARPAARELPQDQKFVLTVNERHQIHHIPDKGYEEAPIRVENILAKIVPTGLFERVSAKHFSDTHILAVHDKAYVQYLKTICHEIGNTHVVYPEVFPVRHVARPPTKLAHRVGYYCLDSFSPLNLNAYLAARGAVNCALTAAEYVSKGRRLAYALVRPPGHHAEDSHFGGFCYLNSAAIAAQFLTKLGKVAILDVDYHHGNGQQDIFYRRKDVLTISIHADPTYEYPYFSGFPEERGEGPGKGFNRNIVLPLGCDWSAYETALKTALRHIDSFDPTYLVVALGLDTAKGDPTGTFRLSVKNFEQFGKILGQQRRATLFVQEGGYRTSTLGKNAQSFFQGIWEGYFQKRI